MTPLTGGHALRVLTLIAALVAAACGSQGTSPVPAAAPTLAIPEGWVTVSTTGAELQMAVPPWLQVFDNYGAIFASEAPHLGDTDIPIQLMALPPGVDVVPGPGEDLLTWIDVRLGDPGKGVPVVMQVELPAGPAVRYERLDRVGAPTEWHILAFAIRTPSGVAYLQIDGLPTAWQDRAEDVERIPFFLRIR